MSEIPNRVLSDHLRELLSGRRITAAVFMTYTLETEFFEEEIVSLLASDTLVQEPKVRLVQLEEELRGDVGPIAVYYDPKGLKREGAKRLDIRYVPVRIGTGAFHPKVVLVLTEPADPESGLVPSLVCGVLSANLTRGGWWSSIECAHFEGVDAGSRCSFRDDLLRLLADVRRLGGEDRDHESLDAVRQWIRGNVEQTVQATSAGRLRTRLVAGRGDLLDFLAEIRGGEITGSSLEVISPFLDEKKPSALKAMIERFDIRETRVFLPTNNDGSALVARELYQGVEALPSAQWGRLPQPLLRLGKEKAASVRGVHAKVYRFIKRSRHFEALVVGSHNLTSSAHRRGGNFEASFLVERDISGPLDWWLRVDGARPRTFEVQADDEDDAAGSYVPLQLRYDWAAKLCEAYWGGSATASDVRIESAGVTLFALPALRSAEWVTLPIESAATLEGVLVSTGIMDAVRGDGSRGPVLVQEYNMARKPSLVLQLQPAQVLEYWSRLSAELRATYLTERGGNIPEGMFREGDRAGRLGSVDGFFATFAGIFHGFEMLRKQVDESIVEGKERKAEYLLLGKRRDSLPSLIETVLTDEIGDDPIRSYLMLLCARQLLREYKAREDEFFLERRSEINKWMTFTTRTEQFVAALKLDDDGHAFIDWFEGHFLKPFRRA